MKLKSISLLLLLLALILSLAAYGESNELLPSIDASVETKPADAVAKVVDTAAPTEPTATTAHYTAQLDPSPSGAHNSPAMANLTAPEE